MHKIQIYSFKSGKETNSASNSKSIEIIKKKNSN